MNEPNKTYVLFRNGSSVILLHYTNNFYAAKRDMLKLYGKTESDIVTTGSVTPLIASTCKATFDGTGSH